MTEDPWLLVEPHRQRLIRMAYRRLGNWQDAEDAAQDAMIKVATYAALDPARVGELLTSTTVRVCTDVLRHRGVVARKTPDLYEPAPDPLADLLDRAEAHFLATVPLTKVERALLIARIHGLHPSEVAASLGLSVSAAKSALFRARRKIVAAWKVTLGWIGLCRLRRLLPAGGAVVLAVTALVLRLPPPPMIPAWEHEAAVEDARDAAVHPAPAQRWVSRPTVAPVRPEGAGVRGKPPPPVPTAPDVRVPPIEGPVWHRGSGIHIDMSEDPVTRVQRCARNGLDVDIRTASLTCRE